MNNTINESRLSLLTKLAQGRFDLAEDKIQDNLDNININLSVLSKYQSKISTEKLKKDYIAKGNHVLESTGNLIEETFVLIQEFKNHKFLGFGEKLKYLKLLDANHKRCIDYKAKFESISEDIKKQNVAIVENVRQSRLSRQASGFEDGPVPTGQLTPQFQLKEYEYKKDDLDDSVIENRGSQINLISDITKKLLDLSKYGAEIAFRGEAKVGKIEYNINEALINVKNAKDDIGEANRINEQRNSGDNLFATNKIMLILVIVVGCLLFLAIFK
jgi:hypothetical protein